MEFLGIGLPELLVILLITLIVVGPQRLPEMAAQIARAMREFRRYTSSLSREVTDALGDLEKEYNAVREEWKDVGEAVRQDVKAMEAEVSGAVEDARAGLKAEERPAAGQTTPQEPSAKVISMEDAASRRSGRPPEDSPDPPSTDTGDGDQRPAGQGHS
jgi:sec-independent protein translocase protein TatA